MTRSLTAALVALFFSLVLAAQPTGGVQGTVIARGDRAPVPDASVMLTRGTLEIGNTVTDREGRFYIGALPDGNYDLLIEATQFLETRIHLTVLDGAVRNLFEISLTQSRPDIYEEMAEEYDMEGSGYNDRPTVLFDQNDVFNSLAGYNFSSVRFNVRGYTSETQDVYLAGVKLNDAITGYSPFSLWSGLNEATRNKTSVTGAEVSDYGLGGYNGLTNIYADAPNVRTGLRGSVLTNSALYRLRLMLTYGTGVRDKGWSFAFSASARLGGNDWVDGIYYRSFAYFASVSKSWDRGNRLSFTILGAPGSRGAQNASTQEVYDLTGDYMYNSNWGYQAGRLRNSRVRNTHEPIAFLKYDFAPSSNFSGSMTVLYRFGTNGYTALDWNDAQDPRPDYYRNLPSYFWKEDSDYGRSSLYKYAAAREAWEHPSQFPSITQLNWDRLYDVNRANIESGGMARSKYIQEERYTDQRELNFAARFKWRVDEQATFTGGFSAKANRTEFYKKVADLLGGEYYLDVDSFAEREYGSVEAKIQNDLDYWLTQGSARSLKVGDKFGYDYYAQVRKGEGWLNGRFALGSFSMNIGGTAGLTAFWREGLVRKGLFPGLRPDGSDFIVDGVNLSRDANGKLLPSSYGKSKVQKFLTWSGKLSINWVIGGKARFYANAAVFNDAPNFSVAYLSPRTRDSVVEGLEPVRTYTADANFQFSGNGYNLRLTGFYTKILNQTDVMSAFDDLQNAFSNFALSGIDEQHYGVELGFKVPFFVPNLYLQGALSAGRYEYTSNPTMVQTVDNSAAPVEYGGKTSVLIPYWMSHPVFKREINGNITDEIDHFQKHYVPDSPQLASSIGLAWNHNYWFIEGDFEYFAETYLSMNPLYRTDYATAGPDGTVTPTEVEYMASQERFAPYYLVNFSIGKSWYIDRKYQIGFSLNAKNLLNRKDVRTGGYEQTRIVDNTTSGERYYRFDSKYFYMSGFNYMLNIYFRF